jgi:hypothetical protein
MTVGPVYGGDGTTPPTGRQGKTGETTTALAHGKYYEPASRGVLFSAADQGAGTAYTLSISTTAIFSLYNPLNSKIRVAIKKVSVGYISGTLPAGMLAHCANPFPGANAQAAAPSGGVALTVVTLDVGNLLPSVPQALARTGSTVVAPVVLWPLASSFAELATTANGLQQVYEDVNGAIVLEPGGCYQLQGKAVTGSTPLVSPGVVWEEIPIVATQG